MTLSILHCFADTGIESDVLTDFGEVTRLGIDPTDSNDSSPIRADAHVADSDHSVPIKDSVSFDLGLFHPPCAKWSPLTKIRGDPDDHADMIASAREIAVRTCDNWIIENVPDAPLHQPTLLKGSMFGLPIAYNRAFETSFDVPQPPRQRQLLTTDGASHKTETSSFFSSERSLAWWAAVKGYAPNYTKQHLSKNSIPASFIRYLLRMWLIAYEDSHGITETLSDYSDWDNYNSKQRATENKQLDDFASGVSP